MGFDLTRATFRLLFDMPEYAGLEVVCKSAGVDELAKITALADGPTVASVLDLVDAFAAVLVEWNVEQDGEPVSPDADGLRRLDYPSLMVIVRAWLDAVAGHMPAAAPVVDEDDLPMSIAA